MKKLNQLLDRFAFMHPNFGIPGLMRFYVAGNVAMFFLIRLTNYSLFYQTYFDFRLILQGQIWRLLTFLFIPDVSSPIMLLIHLYFAFFIGNLLEQQWGTPKFNLFCISGVVLTILAGIIGYFLGGGVITGSYYIYMSMFLAVAALFPDMQVLLFFFIPLKIKWLAWLDIALFVVDAISGIARGDFMAALLPAAALLNVLLFFFSGLLQALNLRRAQAQYQRSPKVVQFRAAAQRQKQEETETAARGYRRKCCVCGRTDTDYPDLEFRYCSRCAGYHCFCADHIFSHEHFTTE